jgi:hypothetical protein
LLRSHWVIKFDYIVVEQKPARAITLGLHPAAKR